MQESTQSLVARYRDRILTIAESHGARKIRLFGSTARGTATGDSDIDLLIDLEPGRSLFDIVAIKQDIEDVLGRRVDVVTRAALSPYIRERVLGEAVDL